MQSCLIKRYCEKRFVSKYMATLGIDFGVTRLKISKHDVKVNIFDLSGQPFFFEVRPISEQIFGLMYHYSFHINLRFVTNSIRIPKE